MKIAIIGSGWFGCHLAHIFTKKKFEVTIFEKENKIFQGQSGFNSNRLHLGFHYPRAKVTRDQCKNSYKNFKAAYPMLVKNIRFNYIGIHKNSKVKFSKYIEIMRNSNLKFSIVKNSLNLKNVTGLIKCSEMLIKSDDSKAYFEKKLKNLKVKLNYKVLKIKGFKNFAKIDDLNTKFDWVLDCTGCSLKKINNFDLLYEPRITLIYKSKLKDLAIMLMDGKYWSIYPIKNNLYSLGSVINSRLTKGHKDKIKADKIIKKLKISDVNKIKQRFENQVTNDYPNFRSMFKYHSYYTSVATISNSIRDERPSKIYKQKRVISILGGKIDTVIEVGEKIKKIIR